MLNPNIATWHDKPTFMLSLDRACISDKRQYQRMPITSLQCCSHFSNMYVFMKSIKSKFLHNPHFWPWIFALALDNIKNFEHDDWQLSPENIGLEWDAKEPTDDDLIEDDDFDPEEAYNHMVDMMGRFRAHWLLINPSIILQKTMSIRFCFFLSFWAEHLCICIGGT